METRVVKACKTNVEGSIGVCTDEKGDQQRNKVNEENSKQHESRSNRGQRKSLGGRGDRDHSIESTKRD